MTLFNKFGAPVSDWFQSSTATVLAAGSTASILPQAGSGNRWVITDYALVNTAGNTDSVVQILGTGNALLWNIPAQRTASGPISHSLGTPIISAENSHVYLRQLDAALTTFISVSGFKRRV